MLTNQFKKEFTDGLDSRYASCLQSYLAGGGEQALQQAYELGRTALIAGLGILDVAELHHQALNAALQAVPPSRLDAQMKRAMIFFEESLSPFEITHQGYRDAVEIMRRVSNFAFMASHEVKAPLTSILSSASMLQEMLGADRRSAEGKLLANVLNAVAILKSRTDDMMDIASMYAGTLSIRIRPVHLPVYLRQVYEHLEPEVRWRGMAFNLKINGDLPDVEIDPDRIQQVITNLVQNAVKYAAEGGRIDLEAGTQECSLLIRVKDHGKGLPIPFGRGDVPWLSDRPARLEPHPHGTGLGLLLCQQIIDAHHGSLNLISRVGKGSTVEVRLPLPAAHGNSEQTK